LIGTSVVFLTIVAAVAVPNLKLARMTADGASAKRALLVINAAEVRFAELHPDEGYVCSLATVAQAAQQR
jgi:hypothetical protein